MINRLHARFHRPENGWDPVPFEHAFRYSNDQWSAGINERLLDDLDYWVGGLKGKRVLDLGGGPGHYSIAFAKRGAHVVWYDVSHTYRNFAEQKAKENQVTLNFSLGYLDEALEKLGISFDLVFNRICFNYGWNDVSFSDVIFQLVRPGGAGYVDTTHSLWRRDALTKLADLKTRLNELTGIKIGHPFPPHGRLAKLFFDKPVEKLLVDYGSPHNDRIFFTRALVAK